MGVEEMVRWSSGREWGNKKERREEGERRKK
jgi:hypothetical protein